jgi:hypothetical protein
MGTWRVWQSAIEDIRVAIRGYLRSPPFLRAQNGAAFRYPERRRKRQYQRIPEGPWVAQC